MKLNLPTTRKARIEMLPLIDIVFLLLVFFIYAMLSMAVHRGLPVVLPAAATAETQTDDLVTITIQSDNQVFVNEIAVNPDDLPGRLTSLPERKKKDGVLLFADKTVAYETVFRVMDQIRMAGIQNISLQAGPKELP